MINDGLQACYPLDCNAANMAATGSALNGLMTSGLTCTTGVLGTANTALAFPGSPTEYVQLPNSPLLKPTGSNAQISFSAWVRFNTVSTSQYIVFAQNTCTSGWFEGYTLAGVTTGGGFKLQAVKAGARL